MREIQSEDYANPWPELLRPCQPSPLDEGHADSGQRQRLSQLDVASAFPQTQVQDRELARCCLSGVWLLHNFLDESHSISQNIDSPEGSYWHGIMHRRELDFGNSKYWFRRAGRHAIHDELQADVRELLQGWQGARELLALRDETTWQPDLFVDVCQQATQGGLSREAEANAMVRQVAFREWLLLFDFCYRGATGS